MKIKYNVLKYKLKITLKQSAFGEAEVHEYEVDANLKKKEIAKMFKEKITKHIAFQNKILSAEVIPIMEHTFLIKDNEVVQTF